MRLQLAIVAVAGLAGTAHADGELAVRGVYYKERATRVMQPMLDALFDAGSRGIVNAHFLVDAITSASGGAGGSGADAIAFTETRYEGGLGYTHELDGIGFIDRLRLGADSKFSSEPDYKSFYIGARGELELAQKNATIGFGGGLSADTLDNSGIPAVMGARPMLDCSNTDEKLMDQKSCELRSQIGFLSASQIVSKNALVAVSYDISKLHGFTANPYRQVVTSTSYVPEKHPNDRLRQAIAVSGRYYLPQSQTTFIGAYRYYRDDWKIRAHTPELRIIQQVGSTADAAFRYRYYTQTAAFFYERRYRSADPAMNNTPYFTDDPKMTAFTGHILEAKLGFLGETFELPGRWAGVRFEGILEYAVQHNRFGNAFILHAAITLPFDY